MRTSIFLRIQLIIRKNVSKVLNILAIFDHITAGRKNLIFKGDSAKMHQESVAIYVVSGKLYCDSWEEILFNTLKDLGFQIEVIINGPIEKKGEHINRENRGYDLAAIKDFFDLYSWPIKELLLINSSIACNHEIRDLILNSRAMSLKDGKRIICATESIAPKPHAQSYFFYTSGEGVRILISAYRQMRNWRTKRATVVFGEIEILSNCIKYGAEAAYLFPYADILQLAALDPNLDRVTVSKMKLNFPLNPSLDFYKQLIQQKAGYVKRNLVAYNPSKLENPPKSIEDAFSTNFN
jgi:hypothetical protein